MKAHQILVKKQSVEELRRKANKARCKGFFTQEDIDLADRESADLYEFFKQPREGNNG